MKRLVALSVAAVAMAAGDPARADKLLPFKPTPAELATLPEYCIERLARDENAPKPWRDQLGADRYLHLHHYCAGLYHADRANTQIGSKHRVHYAQTAIAQFNYVLQRWPEDFPLAQDAAQRKAQMEFQLQFMSRKRR